MIHIKKISDTVLLPVQIPIRDLRAKFLLSLELAQLGIRSIVAPRDIIAKNSTILFKDCVIFGDTYCGLVNDLNNRYVALCEEATALVDPDVYQETRCEQETLNSLDMIFVNNEYHKKLIQNVNEKLKSKIKNCGNPRFDLLNMDYMSLIKRPNLLGNEERRPKVLVTFNGTMRNINNGWLAKALPVDSVESPNISAGGMFLKMCLQQKILLLDSIRLALDLPNYVFVLRPKADELTAILKIVKNFPPNVVISSEGSSLSWIKSSDIVISNNCTTLIEARELDVASVFYDPFPNLNCQSATVAAHSHVVSNYQSLRKIIENRVSSKWEHANVPMMYKIKQNQSASNKIARCILEKYPYLKNATKSSSNNYYKNYFPLVARAAYFSLHNARRGNWTKFKSTNEIDDLFSAFLTKNNQTGISYIKIARHIYCVGPDR